MYIWELKTTLQLIAEEKLRMNMPSRVLNYPKYKEQIEFLLKGGYVFEAQIGCCTKEFFFTDTGKKLYDELKGI